MSEWEEVFDCRGPVDFILAGRRVSVVREEHRQRLPGLTGSGTLARIFSLEQCLPGWVQLVR
jgi:hypothetical protein